MCVLCVRCGVKERVYVGCEVCPYNLKICVNVIMKLRCVCLCVGV